jgi:glycosyltransferase involved in cell wall biosynthesis
MQLSASATQFTVAYDLEHERQSAAGITRYARALATALAERDDVIVTPVGGGPLESRGTLRKKLTTARQDFWWYPYAGRRRARSARADVYHCPSPRAPITRGSPPTVVTIQDLASFRFPETLTRWTRFYERNVLPRSARSAALVIVPTSDTASDVAEFLHVPPDRIRVVPLGVEPIFFEQRLTTRAYPFPYVLFVGTPQPRKNLDRLVAAVGLLNKRGDPDLRLVVAGSDGWGGVDVRGVNVEATGRVTDEQLVRLYQHAECLALVSLHEGFGFPALEAMAAGTPVVASTAGALPEVTGGAAIQVEALSTDSIANGIVSARARRNELVAKGARRAAQFTWQQTAEQTVAVYREIAGTR